SVILCGSDDAVRRGMYRSTVIRSYIHPGMKGTLPAKGVEALAKAVRDMPQNRPDRRRVGRIRKVQLRHQPQTATGNSNHSGVSLQKRKLLDGPIESILRCSGIIARIKS